MALAELIGKIRAKRQAENRTTFGHYLEAVRTLASGGEVDADEVGHIIAAAGKDEESLEADVNLQQQRQQWHATLLRNRQASTDRVEAASELERAQRALQEAIRKLEPAVEAARAKLDSANHAALVTAGAEAWLSNPANLVDKELLTREAELSDQLKAIVEELRPLQADRARVEDSIQNAEFNVSRYEARTDRTNIDLMSWFATPRSLRELQERVTDLKSQLQQLNAAITPREREQRRLQAELDSIYHAKLEP